MQFAFKIFQHSLGASSSKGLGKNSINQLKAFMRTLIQRMMLLSLLVSGTVVHAQQPMKTGNPLPKLSDTGNPIADEKAYLAAKEKWLQEQVGTDKAVSPATEDYAGSVVIDDWGKSKSESSSSKAFQPISEWKLVDIKGVALKGESVSDDALQAETESIQKDFPVGNSFYSRCANGTIRLLVPDRMDAFARESRNGQQLTWEFVDGKCEGCTKTLHATVVSESESRLTFVLSSEDEGAKVAHQFTFEKLNTQSK